MARLIRSIGIAVTCALVSATAGAQQQRPLWEFGVDGMLAHRTSHFDLPGGSTDQSATFEQLPVAMLRAGVYLSPTVELEPAVGLVHSSSNGFSSTQLSLDVGLPVYLSGTRSTDQVFVRPLVGLLHASTSTGGSNGSNSITQFSFGAGLGLKLPIDSRIASRLEAQYRHATSHDAAPAFDQFALLLGLSVYSR